MAAMPADTADDFFRAAFTPRPTHRVAALAGRTAADSSGKHGKAAAQRQARWVNGA